MNKQKQREAMSPKQTALYVLRHSGMGKINPIRSKSRRARRRTVIARYGQDAYMMHSVLKRNKPDWRLP